jgi:BirA family biotin operon repressor/biotin-[acetyl-CoA-carboxylase] ligase
VTGADHLRSTGAEPTGVAPAGVEGWEAARGAWPAGWTVWHVASTGSTNTDLIDRAELLPDRTALFADHQTAGRGRLDRRWEAPPGANLLVSLLFHRVPRDPGELTRRVGLAVVTVAESVGVTGVGLKWPNDVVVDGAKLAGILAQRAPAGPVVVGLGLNVGWAPEGAARLGDGCTPPGVLAAVLAALEAQPADVAAAYRAQLVTLGMRVRVERPGDTITGTAVDVEPDGRLVVIDECAITHRLDVGDIVHLRPA